MTLEFLRDWRGNSKGEIKDVENGVGEAYLSIGVARVVLDKPTLIAKTQQQPRPATPKGKHRNG